MNVETITMERSQALELWKKYQSHRHNQSKVDAEIERVYLLLSQGKVMVDALAEIVKAGADELGRPKLAIVRADQPKVFCDLLSDGSMIMTSGKSDRYGRRPWPKSVIAATLRFRFEAGSMPPARHRTEIEAITPHIPPDIRPKRGLANYHILFEAEWRRAIPVDPILVRRQGNSNLWVVLGAWDLTPVERAVLAGHIAAQ